MPWLHVFTIDDAYYLQKNVNKNKKPNEFAC